MRHVSKHAELSEAHLAKIFLPASRSRFFPISPIRVNKVKNRGSRSTERFLGEEYIREIMIAEGGDGIRGF